MCERRDPTELTLTPKEPVSVHKDNTGVIALSKRDVISKRTKHMEIRHCFLNDCVKRGIINITCMSTDENTADLFTKPLPKSKFEYHANRAVKERKERQTK